MKPIILLIFLFSFQAMSTSQILFTEDFNDGQMPDGWTRQTNATDDGWRFGMAAVLSSEFWQIRDNDQGGIAATNDDACNCDKRNDYLVTPPLDLSEAEAVVLRFDRFYGEGSFQGATETATVDISTDGVNWATEATLGGESGWRTERIDLSVYAGEPVLYIGFRYDDGGGWLFGFAIDNVSLEIPPTLDMELTGLEEQTYGEVGKDFPISGTVFNNGLTTIENFTLAYAIAGQDPVVAAFDNLEIAPFTGYQFHHPTSWLPDEAGIFTVSVEIQAANGQTDENTGNDHIAFDSEIFPYVTPPNMIDGFLTGNPKQIEVAGAAQDLDKPNDLDFFPILARDELWVINERTENTGGSTVTIYGAGSDNPGFLHRVDGNAWHFMSLPTAISFGDNGFFATSPGVQDANHSGGTFTGPTLWTSDPDIYAQPSGGNGSHMDMLHGSPYSMGIEHEADNVYWVFDGWNQTIVRYDFQEDHGPGNDYHADAIVRRYTEISVSRDGSVPSHMVLDRESKWMYVVDNGNDRVLRIDIQSGQVGDALPPINEPLAEHSSMEGVEWEVIISEGLERPCGIDLIENRLLVSDFATGEIIVYDMDDGFEELGRIETGMPGITGIAIGPKGNIWYTNKLENLLIRMEPDESTPVREQELEFELSVAPNPASGYIRISIQAPLAGKEVPIRVSDLFGRVVIRDVMEASGHEIDLGALRPGTYILTAELDGGEYAATIIVD